MALSTKIAFAALAALLLASCSQEEPASDAGELAAPNPLVSVVTVRAKPVTIWDELPGRVSAFRTAEIRPQVSGLIVARSFEEGSEVRKGQPLFQIAPEPFKADVASAEAALQKAMAARRRAQSDLDRGRALREGNNISEQAYDQLQSESAQTQADVGQAEAALKRARLSLSLATIVAPIDGRIGAANVNEGSLAEATSSTSLATIQQVATVLVDIRQPASRLDALRKLTRSGGKANEARIPIELMTGGDGSEVVKATALFSDISVDEGTGNIRLRAIADNRDRILLPGMFVRARVPRGTYPSALLVPQVCVQHIASGETQVYVVDANGKVTLRLVDVGELVDGQYLIRTGLKEGETVVAQGQDKLSPDATVRTTAYEIPTAPPGK